MGDEHVGGTPAKRQDVTVTIAPTAILAGTVRRGPLDTVEDRSKRASRTWLPDWSKSCSKAVETVAVDGFTGYRERHQRKSAPPADACFNCPCRSNRLAEGSTARFARLRAPRLRTQVRNLTNDTLRSLLETGWLQTRTRTSSPRSHIRS